jgi:putative addiction module killer protein
MNTNTINQTSEFHSWLGRLKDKVAKGAILDRINRAKLGNFGDSKDLGDSVSEMRIDVGPGYRVYYAREGRYVYLLICGGDKSSQDSDIKHAKKVWEQFKKEQQP